MTVWKASIAADREESDAARARRLLDAFHDGSPISQYQFERAAPELVRSLLAERDEAVKLLRVHGRCPAPGLFPEAHPRSWTKCDLCAFLARLREQEGTNP